MTQRNKLILASASPRRAKLLTDAGLVFEQVKPTFDDTHVNLDGASPIRAAEALAYLKATSVMDQLTDQSIENMMVIGCDTTLIIDGKMIGKPLNQNEARQMLQSFFGHTHQICSSVALLVDGKSGGNIFSDIAQVMIHDPGETKLDEYIESCQWQNKAGGYNLAELEDQWRFEIVGDHTTVIGLPMRKLLPAIEQFIT